jgi:hypothetical protein
MFERGVLLFTAIVWMPYGAYCFVQPQSLAETAGVLAMTPTGATELRAMYGGLQMGIGVLALVSLARPRLAVGALLAVAFLTAGLASTRLFGAWLDGSWSAYTGGGLFFETLSFGLASVALHRRGDVGRGETG